jgi:hypothetical protein
MEASIEGSIEDIGVPRWKRILQSIEALCLPVFSGMFTFSALAHLSSPGGFALSIAKYAIVPSSVIYLLILILPSLQITISGALIFTKTRTEGFFCAFALFSSFAFAQYSVLARGLTIDCGCFGSLSTQVSWLSAFMVSFFALASLIISIHRYRTYS